MFSFQKIFDGLVFFGHCLLVSQHTGWIWILRFSTDNSISKIKNGLAVYKVVSPVICLRKFPTISGDCMYYLQKKAAPLQETAFVLTNKPDVYEAATPL
jgi:hypothetical protein